MGKGRVRAVKKIVSDQKFHASSSSEPLNVPAGPVYYPTEEEFKDPLEYIYKIRPEAEPYGICKIVPPKTWKPPFALDLEAFKFPTKTQEIHRLQFRPASCDPITFQLEYNRFLEEQGKKRKKKVIYEGDELDLCKLFNAVKRFGGYDKVMKGKKWGDVIRVMSSRGKISECAKHVLSQLYKEHLFDYENYHNQLNKDAVKGCKKGLCRVECGEHGLESPSSKRRKRNGEGKGFQVRKLKDDEKLDQVCEQCKSGLHGEVMLLCDRCNRGWHIYCLSPPLKQIPPGNWYCLECLNLDEETFGFVPGKCLSLEDFKRVADRAKRKWFGSGPVSRMQIEKKFWKIVEGSVCEVEVMYGSDLDTSVCGSGFPRMNDQRPDSVEAKIWNEYCDSPWNLNNLPKLKGSMLQAIHHNITGVMVPWLYVGMLFSSFCWHFEDHCFYSMNYLHWGEPKCWYSVPGSEASAFEKVMRKTLPDLFDSQPDLLFQLVTMLSPSILQENRVPVYTVLQEPGNFVITFPRSFHAGFNFGLNCAEAVNFAPADWLPHGGLGSELYKLYRKATVISHEELLCVIAKGSYDSRASIHLKRELLRIFRKEKTWRERLQRSGVLRSSLMSPRKCPEYVGTEEDPTCLICQQFLHLSAVICSCRPSDFVCLEHWKHLCECKPGKLCLVYRYTLAELHELVQRVEKSGCKVQGSCNTTCRSSGAKGSEAFEEKAISIISVHDHKTHTDLELASAWNSWRIEASRLLEGVEKPTRQQIQQHLKEGQVLKVLPEDCYRRRLTELTDTGVEWAERAKKVATDSGALALEKVFELIAEGENLPIHLKKELEARSMLHCICRKPYDSRSMVACDQCGEWYHTYCIKLQHSRPKPFVCAACSPQTEELITTPLLDSAGAMNAPCLEPKTPSPEHSNSTKRLGTSLGESKLGVAEYVRWNNQKRVRREAKPRSQIGLVPPFFSQIHPL